MPLAGFSLDGPRAARPAPGVRSAERDGLTFRGRARGGVAALLPELRRVSDAWLARRSTREKGFSLGFFDAALPADCPIALVRREGRVVAFANLWTAPRRGGALGRPDAPQRPTRRAA